MDLEIFLFRLLGAVPVFLVWFAGGLLCLAYSRRRPFACIVTGSALAIALVVRTGFPWVTTWLFTTFLTDMDEIKWRVYLQSLMYSAPMAVAWGLLLWAIFGSRNGHSRSIT